MHAMGKKSSINFYTKNYKIVIQNHMIYMKWNKVSVVRFIQNKINVLLILIVSGLVVSGLQHFDEATANLALSSRSSENLCFYYEHFTSIHSCILGPIVWNTENILSDEQFPGIILKSLFGYRDKIYITHLPFKMVSIIYNRLQFVISDHTNITTRNTWIINSIF